MAKYGYVEATIPSGQSLSNGVQIPGRMVGISVPTMDSCALTFQASASGETWRDYWVVGGTGETSIAAGTHNHFYPTWTTPSGLGWLKIRSGTAGSPVAQSADRVIRIAYIYE